MHPIHFASLAVVLGAVLPAQTVWNVSPPADLTQVFANAAPGDVVVLAPGVYSRFDLNQGLTVLGPATIHGADFPPSSPTGPWNSTVQVPAGQQARLVGLDFEQGIATVGIYQNTPHGIHIAGDVSLENCQIGPGSPSLEITTGTVVVQRCTVRRGYAYGGIDVFGGTCTFTASTLFGRDAFNNGYGAIPGRSALAVSGGVFTGSGLTIVGGDGVGPAGYVTYYTPSSPAVETSGAAQVLLTDSTLQAGVGVPAQVAVAAGALVRVARCSLVGAGGGGPFSGAVLATSDLVGMSCTALVRGQTATATAIAGPSQGVLAIVGGFDATPLVAPQVTGPIFGIASGLVVLTVAVPAASASVTSSLPVPANTALLGSAVWLQAAQFAGGGWIASPLVGGAIR